MNNKIEHIKSSGNIFKDMGLDLPDDRLAKAQIASMIYDIIEQRDITQEKAGHILGINQPKVSALKNGRLEGFSMERLFLFLKALDQDVDIIVKPKKQDEARLSLVYSA
ncbi:helix-turn-helix domain-containing protein [Desulfobacter vibrioformis]|uniref:helix-turn-helix domain-containing protein n=1 Tax=Desulfobacter vibrioformis TaxID=34031 RepID=UPI00055576E5|nr:helix-turn-helix transcriptional regulator [Desulfobacter vibrioformis]